MPGIEYGLIAAEGTGMLADDTLVLADLDALCVGTQLDRPTAEAATEYSLFSKRTRQVRETDAGTAWNPSKRLA